MSTKKIITKSIQETQSFSVKCAKDILQKKPGTSAIVLALKGDLGAGKTTFVQGFARGLGIKEKILSPTFILMKKFQIPNSHAYRQAGKSQINPKPKKQKFDSNFKLQTSSFKYFYHFDCYRLNGPEEIMALGFEEIISNPENIIAIEWPEKIREILPENIITIKFDTLRENQRTLTISGIL